MTLKKKKKHRVSLIGPNKRTDLLARPCKIKEREKERERHFVVLLQIKLKLEK